MPKSSPNDASFAGFSPQTFQFIAGLSLNNEKTWFEAHKSEFQQFFQLPMKALGQTVFAQMQQGHAQYGWIHKLSRIYRDARYRRPGDGPYRTSMWFSIEQPTSDEWTDQPVFWFDLGPEIWSYGMGYGGARAATMEKFRAAIDQNPAQFAKLVAFLERQTEFVLEGEEYKRAKTTPQATLAPWYNKKSFSLIHRQAIGPELLSPNLAQRIADGMLALLPLYDFLISLDAD